jgi:hypothetical protein
MERILKMVSQVSRYPNLRPACWWCNNLLVRLEVAGLLEYEDVDMKRIRLPSILSAAIEDQFEANRTAIRKHAYLFADSQGEGWAKEI